MAKTTPAEVPSVPLRVRIVTARLRTALNSEHTGRLMSGAGAALLLAALYVRWYAVPQISSATGVLNAWDAFDTFDAVLVLPAALALWAASVRPTR